MRKIETKMNNAIRKRQIFSNANTRVGTGSFPVMMFIAKSQSILHGNHIATYDHINQELTLFDGIAQSVTTKADLNALCYEFAFTGFSLSKTGIGLYLTSKIKIKPFVDGITVNYNGVLTFNCFILIH